LTPLPGRAKTGKKSAAILLQNRAVVCHPGQESRKKKRDFGLAADGLQAVHAFPTFSNKIRSRAASTPGVFG
jgi:hypothetical protein